MYSRERDIKKEVAFMKVIQISDFHLRGDGKLSFQKADTMKALHQTIDYFCSMKDYELPEFFVVTGDLSEGGTREGYEFMREGLRKLPRPVYIVPGNHDKRDFFLEMFTLLWGPAKDSSIPYLITPNHLDTANSLGLACAYGTFPLGALVFGALASVATFINVDSLLYSFTPNVFNKSPYLPCKQSFKATN